MHLPVSGLRVQTETIWWPLHWFYDQPALGALCRIESLKSVIDILPWRPFQAQDSRQWPYYTLLWAAWSWCYWSQHKINIPPEWPSQAPSADSDHMVAFTLQILWAVWSTSPIQLDKRKHFGVSIFFYDGLLWEETVPCSQMKINVITMMHCCVIANRENWRLRHISDASSH